MNKVFLIGRLARDPELRTTANNLSVARFSLAVSRPFNPTTGQSEADFISCVVWRRQAENLAKYCHKGSQIAVEGRIQTGSYTASDGTKRYTTEVLCDNIEFMGSKADNQAGNAAPAPTFVDNYQTSSEPVPSAAPTTDISEDPFKDFGEEITLSDDDLPF